MTNTTQKIEKKLYIFLGLNILIFTRHDFPF